MKQKKTINSQKTKNKKIKFSATMPEFDTSSESSQQSSQKHSSDFDQSNNNQDQSDQIEVSGSCEGNNEKICPKKAQTQSKKFGTDNEQSSGQISSQKSSEQSNSEQDNKNQQQGNEPNSKRFADNDQVNRDNENQSLQIRQEINQPNRSNSNGSIPQQQVQTDDIYSNQSRSNNVLYIGRPNITDVSEEQKLNPPQHQQQNQTNQELSHQQPNQTNQEQIYQSSQANQEIKRGNIQTQLKDNFNTNYHSQSKIQIEQCKPKFQNNPQQLQCIQPIEEQIPKETLKKKKGKKSKKDKGQILDSLLHHQAIEKPLQSIQIRLEYGFSQCQQVEQIQLQQTYKSEPEDEETEPEEIHGFYEEIHPFLMIIGSKVIESYMKTKQTYNSNQASTWAAELSSEMLLKAYFDQIKQQLESIEEKQTDPLKRNFAIQNKILENKFYKKVDKEMNSLVETQPETSISLSKIYFLIRKFKIIASCMILEKKSKINTAVNISTSCFWNKQKDGQINFSYEGKSMFVMVTLYGVENPRAQNQD